MNYCISALTDVGIIKEINQDSLLVKHIRNQHGEMVFAIICDGMGGLKKGELASASLVNAFNKWLERNSSLLNTNSINVDLIKSQWNNLIKEYNEKLKKYGMDNHIKLGTTVSAILIGNNQYFIVNVGDTRVYEITKNIKQLTKDQTLIAREIELGNISEKDGKRDKRRSVLLQCVGASDEVFPDYYMGDTQFNTVYLVCSDGFVHELEDNEISSYLSSEKINDENELKSSIRHLIELDKSRNERDNISVIAVKTY